MSSTLSFILCFLCWVVTVLDGRSMRMLPSPTGSSWKAFRRSFRSCFFCCLASSRLDDDDLLYRHCG
jgi:hypothetical protein